MVLDYITNYAEFYICIIVYTLCSIHIYLDDGKYMKICVSRIMLINVYHYMLITLEFIIYYVYNLLLVYNNIILRLYVDIYIVYITLCVMIK